MATLAKDAPRAYELGEFSDCPVIATDIIYEGAAVGDNGSGYARPLVAGDPFLGFAKNQADNSTGSAGDINVHVQQEGKIQLAINALAITDVGKPVYASDDNVFTLTASTNTYIGKVVRWVSTGIGIVAFDVACKSGILGALTDNSGGAAANGTIGVLVDAGGTATGAPTTASVADAITELATKLNAVIATLK